MMSGRTMASLASHLIPDIDAAVRRFPLGIMAAVAAAYLLYRIGPLINYDHTTFALDWPELVLIATYLLVFWNVVFGFVGDARGWTPLRFSTGDSDCGYYFWCDCVGAECLAGRASLASR